MGITFAGGLKNCFNTAMKNIYILSLTSCLCGIALSFAFTSVHNSDDGGNERAPSSSVVHSLDEQTAFSIATRLVSDRDAALIAHDHEALQALTVPDSPARTIDDALFESLDGVSALNTVVLDVHVLDDKKWEVHSVQEEIGMGEGSSREGQERCTLWHMGKNPWRLYETSECS